MSSKKIYSKPEITRIVLDNSISLVMMTRRVPNPPPRPRGGKGTNNSFQSPFEDKPFEVDRVDN